MSTVKMKEPVASPANFKETAPTENTTKFIKVISKLTEKQRDIVSDIGFSSLLNLSCSSIPKNLQKWLADKFDTATNSINIPNGFSFQFNAAVVKSLLGIPNGSIPIVCKGTEDSFLSIKNEFNCEGRTPTVDELISLITPEMNGSKFGKLFMLLALSSFLCPNTRNMCSSRYYSAILDISKIKEMDWCSLVLNWLNQYIKKYQIGNQNRRTFPKGGCAFLLVVSYLECLYTSEFNFPKETPRVKFWTTSVVQTYMLLDAIPGSTTEFGRLQVKHVCCTPFRDCYQSQNSNPPIPSFEITEDLINFVKEKCNPSSYELIMSEISELSTKLQQSIFQISSLQVSTFVKSILHIIQKNGEVLNDTKKCVYVEDTDSDCEEQNAATLSHRTKRRKFQEEMDSLQKMFPVLPVPQISCDRHCSNILPQLFSKISSEVMDLPDNSDLDNFTYASYEDLIFDTNKYLRQEINITEENIVIDLLQLAQKNYQDSGMNPQKPPEKKELDFYIPEEEEYNISTEALPPNKLRSEQKSEQLPSRTFYGRSIYGLSLNERVLGPSTCSTKIDNNFPNFDIFGDSFDGPSNEKVILDEKVLQDEQRYFSRPNIFGREFVRSSEFILERRDLPVQTIYPSSIEHDFYTMLTSSISNLSYSPRIFEREATWVDQRTLSLSMMKNGWLHFRVMNCFCKLFSCQQIMNNHMNNNIYNVYCDSHISAILMERNLNLNDYKPEIFEMIGVQPQKFGLVQIPCFIDKQWVLVVANFKHRRFDILSPQHGADETMQITNSVVYNFKNLFTRAYPTFKQFNIRDFPVGYINVPKQQARSDSGIFTLSFMESFDGTSVANLTPADVGALREKKLFHLVFNKHNKARVEVITKFRNKYNIGGM